MLPGHDAFAGKKSFFGKKSVIPYGVYNIGSSNSTTLYDFEMALLYLQKKYSIRQNEPEIVNVPKNELPPAVGNIHCVISTEKTSETLKTKLPSWEESLEHFVKSLQN